MIDAVRGVGECDGEGVDQAGTSESAAPWSRLGQAIHHESVSEGYPGDECGGIERPEIASELGVPASSVFNELRRIKNKNLVWEVERLEILVDQTEVQVMNCGGA